MKMNRDAIRAPANLLDEGRVDSRRIEGKKMGGRQQVRELELHRSSVRRYDDAAQILVVRVLRAAVSPQSGRTDGGMLLGGFRLALLGASLLP
jgi:hypothetical protein